MGKKRVQRKAAVDQLDSSEDDDSLSSISTEFSELTMDKPERLGSLDFTLEKCLDALYEKRGSTREKVLSVLVHAFEGHVLLKHVENKYVTLLHHYINSIKRGSTKEACLASRAMGLLAVTVGAETSAHEIMEEALPHLQQSLKSGSDSLKKISALDCLGIISFVGSNDLDETEKSMKIIWDIIHPKAVSNVGTVSKPTPAILAAAISAWSFLLTTISGWRYNYYDWKESFSFLSTLLEREDRSVRIAAGEAIALIFEIGRSESLSREESHIERFDPETNPNGFSYVEFLEDRILKQARNLSSDAGGIGTAKKDLNNQRDLFQDIVTFLETGVCPEISMKISNKLGILKVSTWTQSIQLNFLKRFLGSGFLKHMQENELLQDVFDFIPEKTGSVSVSEKVTMEIISKGDASLLKASRGIFPTKHKRLFLSPNSALNKERTQMRNKHRAYAEERHQGHFGEDA